MSPGPLAAVSCVWVRVRCRPGDLGAVFAERVDTSYQGIWSLEVVFGFFFLFFYSHQNVFGLRSQKVPDKVVSAGLLSPSEAGTECGRTLVLLPFLLCGPRSGGLIPRIAEGHHHSRSSLRCDSWRNRGTCPPLRSPSCHIKDPLEHVCRNRAQVVLS